jgi:acetyl esterase/lipase
MSMKLFCILLAVTFLSGCTRFDILNSLIPTNDYHLTKNLAYGNLPRQHLDIYQPKNARPDARIVIFFYGGYWSGGKKEDYRFVGEALSSQGLIAVLPDYRIYPDVTFPAFVQDGALAVRWVHDNADRLGGDPQHIYLMGHSAGAHIAALLTLDGHYLKDVGLDRSDIAATAGLSGPYDFQLNSIDEPIFHAHSTTQPSFEPIDFADGKEPPMLLLQGGVDTTVEPGNARRLAAVIQKNGGVVKVIVYPSRGHEGVVLALADHFRWLAPVLRDAVNFFQSH